MSEQKKILESSPFSGIAVPIAIVLVGALIIFGVTKMLSSGKDHKDLVNELNSKTFGNRWVAAYELSKFLAAQKIPAEDMPWVIENLSKVYFESVDARTRNFVVMALGSLNNPLALPVLNKALTDQDSQVKFNAVVSIGNMDTNNEIAWDNMKALFQQNDDVGLKQAVLLTFATHKREEAIPFARSLLSSSEQTLRYSAAIVLIYSKQNEAIPVLEEILNLRYDVVSPGALNGQQVESLKMSALEAIEKSEWKDALALVELAQQNDSNVRVNTKAKQVLNLLKK